MFKYGISCSLEPQSVRQPVILRGDIESIAARAAKAGYDGIELFIREPEQYDAQHLLSAAKAEGLEYCAIATGMEYTRNGLCLIDDDPAKRRAAIDRLKAHMDLGAQLGCPVIAGIMRGNIPDFDRYQMYEDRLTDALAELNAYSEKVGCEIVVESILRYINNYLNSAPETADYLRKIALDHVKLHIDTHSMILEDEDLADSVRRTVDVLAYVHFPDSNRGYPGAGNIDFKPIMRALADVGYEGWITLECVPLPTEYDCAKRGIDYLRALETVIRLERLDYREV